MPDNTGPEENDVETTADHTPVIWPEPSRLEAWWRDIMAGPGSPGPGRRTGTVPTVPHA
ncbi:hypothetical protein IU448_18085 [Nocardia flavorosea]|uniref:hypothetical protein n=1 Tax=Nocardia flavorosea TaxID=53429 RepID=UPI001893D960|nr:hypothetical protein [Nocardia flavorosea]MBF6350911.1 hypothetical protein [Nocardia flavorosea]